MIAAAIIAVGILGYSAYRLFSAARARHALRDQREADSYRDYGSYGEPTTRQHRSTWNDEEQP